MTTVDVKSVCYGRPIQKDGGQFTYAPHEPAMRQDPPHEDRPLHGAFLLYGLSEYVTVRVCKNCGVLYVA